MRCLPVTLTAGQKADITQKRQKLFSRLTKFNQMANQFMADVDHEITFVHQDDPQFCPETQGDALDNEEQERVFWGVQDDNEEDQCEEEDPAEIFTEDLILSLPSSLEAPTLQAPGLEKLMKEEVQLRIGQANDRLERLRTHLGHRAIIFRLNRRSSTSVRTDTRSKQDLRKVARKINQDVRSYNRAREALIRLGAPQDIQQKYQPITSNQLGVSKDITEENRFGQGSDVLPWFWCMAGSQAEGASDEWSEECKSMFYWINCKWY